MDIRKTNANEPGNKLEIDFWTIGVLSYSDYDDSCHVERSNVRMWQHMFAESKGKLWDVCTYMFFGEAIAFLIDPDELINNRSDYPEFEREIETLSALANYPAIDDEDVSRMEDELINDHIIDILQNEILGHISSESDEDYRAVKLHEILSSYPDDEFVDIVRKYMGEYNIQPVIESGGTVFVEESEFFDIEQWMDVITEYGEESGVPFDFPENEITEDDYKIVENRGKYETNVDSEHHNDFDDALKAIVDDAHSNLYYPNVWYINERGNMDLLEVDFGKCTYKIIKSYV